MRYFESMYKLYIELEEELSKSEGKKSYKIKNKKTNPEFGDVYFYSNENLYYVFVEDIDDNFFRLIKMSPFWVLANQNDVILEFDGDKWVVEPWNEFYFESDEFANSTYLGKLNNDDIELLKKVIYENEPIPDSKRGLKVPENKDFFQIKFHKKESEKVRKYKMKIFKYMEEKEQIEEIEILRIPPERLELQPLAASEEKYTYLSEEKGFALYYDKKENLIELTIIKDELIGKPAVLKIFTDTYNYESLPKNIKIEVPEGKEANIDYIGKNIYIEEKVK